MVVVAVMCPPLVVSDSDAAQAKGTLIAHRVVCQMPMQRWTGYTAPDGTEVMRKKTVPGVQTLCGAFVGFVLAYELDKPTRMCHHCSKATPTRISTEPFVGLFTYGGEGAVPAPLGEKRLGKPQI